jgi:hypothetical protein
MIKLLKVLREAHEKSFAKKSAELIASQLPCFFEHLGYAARMGDVSRKDWDYSITSYEAFQSLWERIYQKKLPNYSLLPRA